VGPSDATARAGGVSTGARDSSPGGVRGLDQTPPSAAPCSAAAAMPTSARAAHDDCMEKKAAARSSYG
jgi:hypothetical protein